MSFYHSSFCCSLQSDFGVWVDAEASIKNAVTDLIAKLVGVALTDRLGGEIDVAFLVFFSDLSLQAGFHLFCLNG